MGMSQAVELSAAHLHQIVKRSPEGDGIRLRANSEAGTRGGFACHVSAPFAETDTGIISQAWLRSSAKRKNFQTIRADRSDPPDGALPPSRDQPRNNAHSLRSDQRLAAWPDYVLLEDPTAVAEP